MSPTTLSRRRARLKAGVALAATGTGVVASGAGATDARSVVLASVRGGSMLWLHDDRGADRPDIDGESPPPRAVVRGRTASE